MDSKTKILHIIPTYKPAYSRGGPIWSVHSLNKWLVKKGIDVTVYTTNIATEKPVPLNRLVNVDGVGVYYFPASFPKKWEHSGKLRKAVKETVDNFDLVHITSVFLSASAVGSYYARENDVPYIISPRGALMKNTLGKRKTLLKKIYLSLIEKKNLANAAGIHFTVEKEKQEYIDMGLPLDRAIIIPNGLETDDLKLSPDVDKFREKHNIKKDRKVVLFLSRLSWKKGLDTLIPAFRKVVEKNPKTVLIIAGGDSKGYRGRVVELIEEYDLQGYVKLTGMLLDEDKVAAYKLADVFALPSYSENFGIVCLEAAYFGIPVVTTPDVGIAKHIKESEAGLVVEKDANKVSESILEILNNEKKAKKMGENGKKLAKTEFSMSAVADTWEDVYRDIVEESSKEGGRE